MIIKPLLIAIGVAAPLPQQIDPPPPPPPPPPATAEAEQRGLTWEQIAHRVGGAVIGGWIGFVGAQVTLSDWDKDTNSSFRDQRYTWAAAGAVAGLVASHVVGRSFSPGPRSERPEVFARDGRYLGEAEIRASDARNAYELIYFTRMQWLIPRGTNSIAEGARGEAHGNFEITVTPGRDKIIVYMDDVRLGGVEAMRDVPAELLTSARFLDAREATLRYGGGHAHGVIALSTEVSP